jgi:hypothetical protein
MEKVRKTKLSSVREKHYGPNNHTLRVNNLGEDPWFWNNNISEFALKQALRKARGDKQK